jgi:hypothetical protein
MAEQAETVKEKTETPTMDRGKQDASTDRGRTAASGSGLSDLEKELEDRFEGLDLVGEEETDLDFSGELDDLLGDVRWLMIFRVHTTKPFSHVAMFKQMRNAWVPAQEVTFKTKGANLFLAQFHCLGDWSRVMEGGPWLFRGAALVMAEYDGFTNVEEYKLDKIPIWTRIQGVPEGLMKKKELAEKVARKVGEPPISVIVNEGKINPSKFLRARVHLDIYKPLVRFVPINLKERKKYPVQYERIPDFCKFCGLIGHDVKECGDGIHDDDQCQWGDWLRVMFEPNIQTGVGRGGGARGGFGARGRGRGRPGEANGYETTDMVVVPDEMDEDRMNRKRMSGSEGILKGSDIPDSEALAKDGRVAQQVNLLENGSGGSNGGSSVTTPQKFQPPKRQRKVVNGVETEELIGSATSFEEDRRDQ